MKVPLKLEAEDNQYQDKISGSISFKISSKNLHVLYSKKNKAMHTVWYMKEGYYNIFIYKDINAPWIQIDLLPHANLLLFSPWQQVYWAHPLMGRADFSEPDLYISYRLQGSEEKLENGVWAI